MARTAALAGALVLLAVGGASAAYCHGSPSPDAKPNNWPIYYGDPTLKRSAANGKAFSMGEGDFKFWLLHVYGTPYEMGFAHGHMMQRELRQFFNDVFAYLKEEVEPTVEKFLPKWMASLVAEVGMDIALDLTADATRKYTGDYFFEEARGLADGVGIPYSWVIRVHMIGELTKGSCSMFGAWGNATRSRNGQLLQLRSLDWDVHGPFVDYPAVIVYHPSKLGHAFANVGFLGWIGSITGMSSAKLGISEIGVSYPDPSFGKESRFGIPFTFILRDILQFDTSLHAAIRRLKDAHRTCDLILGVGDGAVDHTFRAIQYSHSVANVQSDTNMMPYNETWHPRMDQVVYYGMDWLCPAYSAKLHEQLQKHYGDITPESTVRDVVSIVQTGDLHVAIYDNPNDLMYVSFASKSLGDLEEAPFAKRTFKHERGKNLMAYDRQFAALDMGALWREPAPVVDESA